MYFIILLMSPMKLIETTTSTNQLVTQSESDTVDTSNSGNSSDTTNKTSLSKFSLNLDIFESRCI